MAGQVAGAAMFVKPALLGGMSRVRFELRFLRRYSRQSGTEISYGVTKNGGTAKTGSRWVRLLIFHDKLHRIQVKILSNLPSGWLYHHFRKRKLRSARALAGWCGLGGVLAASALINLYCSTARAQQIDPAPPVVVQPGAPGKPSRRLPPSTTAKLPPRSQAEAEFMQGMIMHHAQAVEMTALISSHTQNKDLRLLGARISSSQSDEIKFMRRWLAARGEPATMAMPGMKDMNMSGHDMRNQPPLMPGMLTPEQMEALRKAKDTEFDHLFLTGMIQHHNGALIMVKDLFDTAGAGQDAELFGFATDVDSGQRAEIRIMQDMLEKKNSEEKR
jgi:uncharacterized protein (DUF305 family)